MVKGEEETVMFVLWLLYWYAGVVGETIQLPDVKDLTAEAGYHDITVRWKFTNDFQYLDGFQVNYCELQIWGSSMCKNIVTDPANGKISPSDSNIKEYMVIISGLRIAFNYTIHVSPIFLDRPYTEAKPENTIDFISTKHYTANVNYCTVSNIQMEVNTGPYFGGRISVEGTEKEDCGVRGNPESPQETYNFLIDYKKCGISLINDKATAYVSVQENYFIMTYSTRRFEIICDVHVDSLTLVAGMYVPKLTSEEESGNYLGQGQLEGEGIASNEVESVNEVQVSRLQHHRQLIDASGEDQVKGESVTQVVVMAILLVAGIFGVIIGIWWMIPSMTKRYSSGDSISSRSSCSSYENFENSVRDTNSIESDSVVSYQHFLMDPIERESPNVEVDDQNVPGVFTIRIPDSVLISSEEMTGQCVNIERESHSEA